MKVQPGTKINDQQCATCPFREDGEGYDLGHERLAEICLYLTKGENHFCHSDRSNRTICRGGRDYQLNLFHRMGVIDAPTDEALRAAMKESGLDPQEHI